MAPHEVNRDLTIVADCLSDVEYRFSAFQLHEPFELERTSMQTCSKAHGDSMSAAIQDFVFPRYRGCLAMEAEFYTLVLAGVSAVWKNDLPTPGIVLQPRDG